MAAVKKKWWQGKNGPLLIAEIGANHEEILIMQKNFLKFVQKLTLML